MGPKKKTSKRKEGQHSGHEIHNTIIRQSKVRGVKINRQRQGWKGVFIS